MPIRSWKVQLFRIKITDETAVDQNEINNEGMLRVMLKMLGMNIQTGYIGVRMFSLFDIENGDHLLASYLFMTYRYRWNIGTPFNLSAFGVFFRSRYWKQST